jgi:hypothetical protein
MSPRFLRVIAATVGALLVSVVFAVIAPAQSSASGAPFEAASGAASGCWSTEDCFSQECEQAVIICRNGTLSSFPDTNADTCWLWRVDVKGCEKDYGDYIWTKDDRADYRSMVLVTKRSDELGYIRACRNRFGSGTWAECNFDWEEGFYWFVEAWTFNANTDDWDMLDNSFGAFTD